MSLKVAKQFLSLGDFLLLANKMLYIKSCKTLVFGDLHLGVEYALTRDGMFIPTLQFGLLLKTISDAITELKPSKLIILGDMKHTFERRTPQEHKEVLQLLDFLGNTGLEVILVRGNHDTFIRGLLEKKGVHVTDYHICGDYLFTHGHKNPQSYGLSGADLNKKTIIFAHIHPTISLSDGITRKRFPIFMLRRDRVVLPAMSPLLPGLDIFRGYFDEEFKSPLLGSIDDYHIYVLVENMIIRIGHINKLLVIGDKKVFYTSRPHLDR